MIYQSGHAVRVTSTTARVGQAYAVCLAVGIQSSRQQSATTTTRPTDIVISILSFARAVNIVCTVTIPANCDAISFNLSHAASCSCDKVFRDMRFLDADFRD
ncbi:hypothetical protein JG688_00014628 [Phytophthora aleatoria]|uniref:Uncharacterized protein n=1 Tax=Phytophthora aleatoria TaxID=2496075 RepID=A0A8J5I7H8_9STRA|nr:hypothetical protein JG688_00014628 [Phytophthora aleatoria]